MELRIDKAFLLSGNNLIISDNYRIRHPKVKDILALGNGIQCEEVYWNYVMTLLSDPYDNMVWLDDHNIDYESVTPYEVFIQRWIAAKQERIPGVELSMDWLYGEALSFFLGKRNYTIRLTPSQEFCICDADHPLWRFEADFFGVLHQFITQMHCITHAERIQPATKTAKRILIEDTRDEQKRRLRRRQKQGESLEQIGDCISALVFGGPGGVTPFNFQELSIHQLLSGAATVQKKQKCDGMLNGVYTGMLNLDNLPKDELRWM